MPTICPVQGYFIHTGQSTLWGTSRFGSWTFTSHYLYKWPSGLTKTNHSYIISWISHESWADYLLFYKYWGKELFLGILGVVWGMGHGLRQTTGSDCHSVNIKVLWNLNNSHKNYFQITLLLLRLRPQSIDSTCKTENCWIIILFWMYICLYCKFDVTDLFRNKLQLHLQPWSQSNKHSVWGNCTLWFRHFIWYSSLRFW